MTTSIGKSIRGRNSYNPVLLVFVALCIGIFSDRFVDCRFAVELAFAIGGILVWWSLFFLCKSGNRRTEAIASLALLVSIMGLGAGWHHGRWNWFPADDISLFASSSACPVCLLATVRSEPQLTAAVGEEVLNPIPSDSRTRFRVELEQIRNGRTWQPVAGQCDLVVHAKCREIGSGDRVLVFGRLVKILPPTNPGQFDFYLHHRADAKLVVVHVYTELAIKREPSRSDLSNVWILATIRRSFNDWIWRYIDAERAGLASAILLGNREQLTVALREEFMETGTVHLLAISGLHVGILAGAFFLLFRIGFSSRKTALLGTIAFVIFYAWLVEFRPPVTRAMILLVLICVGRLIGKQGFRFNLLAAAGLVVLMINPADLFRVGPQLSFLAVSGIIFFRDWIFYRGSTEPLDELIRNTRSMPVRWARYLGYRVRQVLLVSGLIWLLALPLVAFHFHIVAPVAPLLNPLLLLPMTLALYGGMGVLLFGGWLQPVADLFGAICTVCLRALESTMHFFQGLPFSHYWTAGPTANAILFFYLGFLLMFICLPKSRLKRWLPLGALLWLVWAWMVPVALASYKERGDTDGDLICTFVDVGHGTSVLVQTPEGRSLLYDAGTFGAPRIGLSNVSGLLWSEGIEHLDALVISHADVDHFNAIPELCQRFSIGAVYISSVMESHPSESVQFLFDRLMDRRVKIGELNAGDCLVTGSHLLISVLSPPVEGTGATDNSDSIVLLIEAYGRRFLLPGDLESSGMDLLIGGPGVDCDVVMAPHHGSLNSRPREFLEWSHPEYVLVSASQNRVSKEIINALSEGGRQVSQTGSPGAFRYRVSASGRLSVECYSGGEWKRKKAIVMDRHP
ncbi:MAG: ComEC/Rec2 family competence protein [Mariniblastus sp.]|nr:ComEC/Rec2 family competence protein [Mariniblastus sp.]